MNTTQIETLFDETALLLGQAEFLTECKLADKALGEKLAQMCRAFLATHAKAPEVPPIKLSVSAMAAE